MAERDQAGGRRRAEQACAPDVTYSYDEVYWLWSDQDHANLQDAGFHSTWEQLVVRGDLGSKQLSEGLRQRRSNRCGRCAQPREGPASSNAAHQGSASRGFRAPSRRKRGLASRCLPQLVAGFPAVSDDEGRAAAFGTFYHGVGHIARINALNRRLLHWTLAVADPARARCTGRATAVRHCSWSRAPALPCSTRDRRDGDTPRLVLIARRRHADGS